MKTFESIYNTSFPGEEFWVNPETFNMTPDKFHQHALQWKADGGTNGFAWLSEHKNSTAGRIDLVRFRRDDKDL